MSIKRQATTQITRDNWDQEEPAEEMGTFQTAPKEVLEKRVIRTAKRRAPISGDEPKKSAFSGFGGFNKTQPSSFDFLANLTNGSKSTNGSASNLNSGSSSNVFSSKPATGGLFGTSTTSSPSTQRTFGIPSTQTPFGSSAAASPSGPTGESPFKMPTTVSAGSKTPTSNITSSSPQASSVLAPTNSPKSIFGLNATTSTPFKMSESTPKDNVMEKKQEKADDKKINYYTKLKGLNESVLDWIKKHVEESPICILSPIFKDYEKHLKVIQEEFFGSQVETQNKTSENKPAETQSNPVTNVVKSSTDSSTNNTTSTQFTASALNTKPTLFGTSNTNTSSGDKPSGFSFGIKTNSVSATSTSSGFTFGANSNNTTTTSAQFSFGTNTSTSTNAATNSSSPFSFGLGKPFSFNSNIQTNSEEKKDENEPENDEPPKVEFTPVVEENSVFEKKCKVFVKKDDNFADKGVGTLYVKKIEETGKHQLLVRANTNLGTILLNMMLSSSIPTQRLGKNNVMLVCIPTPDHKGPPTTVLIRVKTSEEADELLETLNKFKA